MSNGNQQMQVEFHNRANTLFGSICNAFENDVVNVSRRNEEFRFQQIKKQYARTMEQQLQTIAGNILAKNKEEKQVRELDQMFHQAIKEYLHRFIQKVNDL